MDTLDTQVEPVGSEHGCQMLHHMVRHPDILHLQNGLYAPDQALHVRHGIFHIGLGHNHIQRQIVIIKLNAAFLQGFLTFLEYRDFLGTGQVCGFHPGLIGRGNVRHQNRAVGQHLTIAAEPPALIIFLLRDMAAGDRLQLSLQQLHTALAAGAVTGTGCVNGHVGTARQLQQVISLITFNGDRAAALDLEGYFHSGKFLSEVFKMTLRRKKPPQRVYFTSEAPYPEPGGSSR